MTIKNNHSYLISYDGSRLVLSPIVTRPAAKQQHRVLVVGGGPTHYVVTPNLCWSWVGAVRTLQLRKVGLLQYRTPTEGWRVNSCPSMNWAWHNSVTVWIYSILKNISIHNLYFYWDNFFLFVKYYCLTERARVLYSMGKRLEEGKDGKNNLLSSSKRDPLKLHI